MSRCTAQLYEGAQRGARCIMPPGHDGHHRAAKDPREPLWSARLLRSFDLVWWPDRPGPQEPLQGPPAPIDHRPGERPPGGEIGPDPGLLRAAGLWVY